MLFHFMFPNPDEPAVLFKTASILNLSNCNLILDTREGGPFVIVKKKNFTDDDFNFPFHVGSLLQWDDETGNTLFVELKVV